MTRVKQNCDTTFLGVSGRDGMTLETGLRRVQGPYGGYDEFLESLSSVIVFGAGSTGMAAKRVLESLDISVDAFCDNDPTKHGQLFGRTPVIPVADLDGVSDDTPILICSDWTHEIAVQLAPLGRPVVDFSFCWDYERWKGHFSSAIILESITRIERAFGLLADDLSRSTFLAMLAYRLSFQSGHIVQAPCDSYLHPQVIPEAGDVIVDGGAWEGDTALLFSQHVGGQCTVFAFEPNPDAYENLEATVRKSGLRCTPVRMALYDKTTSLFLAPGQRSSHGVVAGEGEHAVQTISVDEFCAEKGVWPDLIKLDIEGAERRVLRAASEALKRNPKLQICLYHHPTDLWELPLLLNELNPAYEIHLAHHSQYLMDTIMYARVPSVK